MIPLRYNLRSLAVRKTTTIATAVGIGLVVFVLSSSQMLASGIRNTLGRAGEIQRAIVLRKGADTEISSNLEQPVFNLIMAAPGVKHDASGQPLGVGEVAVVIALEKPNTGGQVSNVAMRGVPENILQPRSTWKSPADYDAKARDLANRFVTNFKKFSGVSPEVAAAGLRAG